METRKHINSLLVKHTKQTEKAVEKATSFDHYFNPQEAVDFGLCDKIISFDKIMED